MPTTHKVNPVYEVGGKRFSLPPNSFATQPSNWKRVRTSQRNNEYRKVLSVTNVDDLRLIQGRI